MFLRLTHVDGFLLVVNSDAINYYHTTDDHTDITLRDGEVVPVSEPASRLDDCIKRLGPDSIVGKGF